MKKTKTAPLNKNQLPFYISNLQKHFEHTFDLWTIKTPTAQEKLLRSTLFIAALLITIYWPVKELFTNFLLLNLVWILLSLSNARINRLFLLTNLMLNISWLYYFMRLFLPVY